MSTTITREQRQRELMILFNDPKGRHQLLGLLRQQMQVPTGQALPLGTPIVQSILNHEFAEPPV